MASDRVQRIVFHEITESAIKESLKNPRGINMNLVDAQQARRVLDRLVGYKLSPFLWEKIMKRLSAGRVQSVALRLIAEREEEIRNFKTEEYWSIVASLLKIKNQPSSRVQAEGKSEVKSLEADLYKINNEAVPKLGIKTQKEAKKIVDELEKCEYKVSKVEKKALKRNPPPPFTTSSLQQEASRRFYFSAKQTMRLAQILYENGYITYMRTDSLNISQESAAKAKKWIEDDLGREYAAQAPRFFKTQSKNAQEAHEAIRPTEPDLTPQDLKKVGGRQKKAVIVDDLGVKLYDLIWRRFIASQLPQAVFDSTKVEITAQRSKNSKLYILNSSGSILRFDGFLKIWLTKFEEKELPDLKEKEGLDLGNVIPGQHFTEPPPRYNEASLVKALEEYGIGRPSTYAPIISVIQDRNYVYKNEGRRFQPTPIGELVNKVLVKNFPEVVDIQFTAKIEEKLDEIAQGKEKWQDAIRNFYSPFSKDLEEKYKKVEKVNPPLEETDEKCGKCGRPMVVKLGRYGKFLACSGFPECRNTKSLGIAVSTDKEGKEMSCPRCGDGKVVGRRTKKGRFFYGCSRYPDCDFASWSKP